MAGRPTISRRGFLGAGASGASGMALTAVGLPGPARPTSARVGLTAATTTGATRQYWIQADSFSHNLVPTGRDEMMGMKFRPSDSTYRAVGYRAYSPNWGHALAGNDDIGANTGIPGPVIRAEVGDTVLVHFKNNDSRHRWPHSMHPHGFRYTPANDGGYVYAERGTPGRAIPFGGTYTYTWTAMPNSVGTWPYHDHSLAQGITKAGPVMEFNAELGMFGLIAITDHTTPPVDREFPLFFHDLYQDDVPSLSQDFDCFNGASYLGNTPTFTAKVGDRVRWRVAALGKEFHVFHIHGHRRLDEAGRNVDSQMMGPSTTLTVEYTEDNPGDWLYHCHVTDHMAGGMVGWYRVTA
jgi:manganese oxidase